MADEYHRKGGPADKLPPVILAAMLPGTLWRGLVHHPSGNMVDLGDISVLEHTSKGLECFLFKVNRRMIFPYPNDDCVYYDTHNHIRIHDGKGNIFLTFAPA